MAARRAKPAPDPSPAKRRPIELVTENGFCILRAWEIDRLPPPLEAQYRFLVRNPHGLERARDIIVDVSDQVAAQVAKHTRDRIGPRNSFWIYCAERHLATYVWEHDDYPPDGRLTVEQLEPDDFDVAMRWETT